MTEKRGVPDRNPPNLSPQTFPNPQKAPAAALTPKNTIDPPIRFRSRVKNLLLDWRFVASMGLVTTLSLTAVSTIFLLKIPALPNCPSIFWPLASASLRLHCAQLAASKRTAKDLIEAIELVSTLPNDHPLYEEASRWIEDWSKELLDVAQEEFNKGDLNAAIAAAKKIPSHAAAAKQVSVRIQEWQTLWNDAEAIVKKVDYLLAKRNWRDAFNEATKLLAIDNPYWQNKRYVEVGERITIAKDEITKIAQADRAIESGSADELLKSLQDLDTIPDTSAFYKDAQDVKSRMGRRLISLAEAAADRGSFDEALRIANKIPDGLRLKQDTDDFITLVGAQSKAARGNSLELEDAISQASRVPIGHPLYDRAQRLVSRWQAEIRDIAQLNRARDLASAGNPESIQAAIAEASQIGPSNPKYREARDFIEKESRKLQIKSPKFASGFTPPVIADPTPSPTSSAAPTAPNIAQFPSILGEATRLAESGDLPSAIATAQQITSDSPLYDQAQARITKWQTQSDSEQSLQQAIARAGAGNPDDLLNAIAIAQQVPNNSSLKAQAKQAVDQWSEQILQAAIAQSAYDAPGAITLAGRIPIGTSAFGQSQLNISRWKKELGQR